RSLVLTRLSRDRNMAEGSFANEALAPGQGSGAGRRTGGSVRLGAGTGLTHVPLPTHRRFPVVGTRFQQKPRQEPGEGRGVGRPARQGRQRCTVRGSGGARVARACYHPADESGPLAAGALINRGQWSRNVIVLDRFLLRLQRTRPTL